MAEWILDYTGSKGDIYTIAIQSIGKDFRITCNCEAGKKRQLCKHRKSIMFDSELKIPGVSKSDLSDIRREFRASNIYARFEEIQNLESEKEAIERAIASKKKAIELSFGSPSD